MTITHISHFGLAHLATTSTNVVFEGSKGDCMRMAFAHGMEVEKYEGAIISSNCGVALYAPSTPDNFAMCYFKDGGLIAKGRDGYCLVMPLELWEKDRI